MFGTLICLGIDHGHIRHWTVGDKHLASVQYIPIRLFCCPRCYGSHIRASARFGEAHASNPLARREFGNIFFALCVCSLGKYGVRAKKGVGAVREGQAAVYPGLT